MLKPLLPLDSCEETPKRCLSFLQSPNSQSSGECTIRVGQDYQATVPIYCTHAASSESTPFPTYIPVEEEMAQTSDERYSWTPFKRRAFAVAVVEHKKRFDIIAKVMSIPIKSVVSYYYREFKKSPDYVRLKRADRVDLSDACARCGKEPTGRSSNLFGCDSCNKWFCFSCTGEHSPSKFPSDDVTWACPQCQRRGARCRKSTRDTSVCDKHDSTESSLRSQPPLESNSHRRVADDLVEESRVASRPLRGQRRKPARQSADNDEVGTEASARLPKRSRADSCRAVKPCDKEVLWNGEWLTARLEATVAAGLKFGFDDGTVTIVPIDEAAERVRDLIRDPARSSTISASRPPPDNTSAGSTSGLSGMDLSGMELCAIPTVLEPRKEHTVVELDAAHTEADSWPSFDLVLRSGLSPNENRPGLIGLTPSAIAQGIVFGRSANLSPPSGIRLQPLAEDVASVDPTLVHKKVVSRMHARVHAAKGEAWVWVEDLGSTNGTWVDGTRLAPHRRKRLVSGSRLQFGLPGFNLDYSLRPRCALSMPPP